MLKFKVLETAKTSKIVEYINGLGGKLQYIAGPMQGISYTYSYVYQGVEKTATAYIGDSMGMDDINNDRNPHSVRIVNKGFKLFRSSKSRGAGEKTRNMVSERSIVGMLHYRHYLQSIVAERLYARKDILAKFAVSAYSLLVLSHTDMTFVDAKSAPCGNEAAVLPLVFGLVHDDRRPKSRLLVLNYALGIKRNSLEKLTTVLDDSLYQTAVPKRVLALKEDLKNAVADRRETKIEPSPIHHIAREVDLFCGRCPFAIEPSVLGLVKAEILVTVGKITKTAVLADKLGLFAMIVLHSLDYIVFIRQERGIALKYLIFHNPSAAFLAKAIRYSRREPNSYDSLRLYHYYTLF